MQFIVIMKKIKRVFGVAVVLSLIAGGGAFALRAQEANQAAQEKDVCIRNLKEIYEAIQAYRRDHKDLPNWLSDLVPKYLKDPAMLVCPVSRRTGRVETFGLSDPKITSSYLFEFCDTEMGKIYDGGKIRMRDWKRRQMGLVGSAVPNRQ